MSDVDSVQRIHKLPETLVNQIAAGEVIERPASVVKELLENSLDANATNITIEIKRGGSRLIRIQDNGHGIHADDLVLAIDRHTTSKIHSPADLARITTLGFRGEALSSIASVSRFILSSRQLNAEHGWTVKNSSQERMPQIQPAAHPVGTTVEVRDLFYNIPARRKFMRSEKTEYIHIQELVKRIALSRFNVSIRLYHNDRRIFHCAGMEDDPAQRVRAIHGESFFIHSLPVDQLSGGLHLRGWLGKPVLARSQSDQQYFYLNGRIIRDKQVNHAIRMAFQDLLYPGRYATYILYLEMDASAADVNVHPAKHEVRFREARNVHDFIYSSLANVLHACNKVLIQSGDQNYSPPFPIPDINLISDQQANYPNSLNKTAEEPIFSPEHGKALALIKGRFLIAESVTGVILVDVRRARELITGVRLQAAYKDGGIRSRPVLVPLMLSFSESDAELIMRNSDVLKTLGLVIERIAPVSILIRELPLMLIYADATALIVDIINVLRKVHDTTGSIDKLIVTLANHASDSAPQSLTLAEMNTLLGELKGVERKIQAGIFQSAWRSFDMRELDDLFQHGN
ncbi:MAG: DNA mismatch repair endonuclease MutL [Gammaproteobacteria bacterium]|nr:DNA mismatch repair endonuclease MutL [Gammaproteobacteria bacterium]